MKGGGKIWRIEDIEGFLLGVVVDVELGAGADIQVDTGCAVEGGFEMMCEKPFVKTIPGDGVGDYLTSTPLPCGRCLHCRINRSRMWQTRIMLESMAHEKNSFVTLTYDNKSVPFDCKNLTMPLVKKDLQDYLKRLRKLILPQKIRYYAVGEYGQKQGSWRPHFHLIIFGLGDVDRDVIEKAWNFKYNRKNKDYERSNRGFVYIGSVTKDSARYVTQYVTKSLSIYNDWYYNLLPDEFATMSKMNGGLGIEVMREIAKKLDSEEIDVVETLNIKGKEINIGRYLRRKLHEFRGLDEEKFKELFGIYRNELYSKHVAGDGAFIENFMEEDRVKRLKKAHNIKTFRKRGNKL